MRDRARLERIISEYFEEPFNELFKELIEPSIGISSVPNQLIRFGQSKFGGNPHVGAFFEWPTNKKKHPLTFLCQINLTELHLSPLPETGLLYFFFDWDNIDFGRVIYVPDANVNSILPRPVWPRDYSFKKLLKSIFKRKLKIPRVQECSCELHLDYHVPDQESIYFELLTEKHKISTVPNVIYKEDVYEEDLLGLERDNEEYSNHRLLGNYTPVQNGYIETLFVDKETKNRNEMHKEAIKWKLLLQVNSDENIKFTWGDSGQIYFFIHEQDLANHDFSSVKMTGDCN